MFKTIKSIIQSLMSPPVKKINVDPSYTYSYKYRDRLRRLRQNWINREVEFRNNTNLSQDSIIYKGRIFDIAGNLALAKITHETSFPVKTFNVMKPRSLNMRQHFKIAYRKNGHKYPFVSFDKELYHLLQFAGNRWKSIGVVKMNSIFGSNWNYFDRVKRYYA